MKPLAHKPGFGEQLWKKGAPIAAFAGAVVLFNVIQNNAVSDNKAGMDRCLEYTFESQRNDCITETSNKNTWVYYGALAAESAALLGIYLTAKPVIDGLRWQPKRPKR